MRTLSAIAVYLTERCGIEGITRASVHRTALRLGWSIKNSRVKDTDWLGCSVQEFKNDIIEIVPSRYDYDVRDPRNPLSLGL